MKEPTKADLAAAVAKLTAENAGLRDLLAAVHEAAAGAPMAAIGEPAGRELHRACDMLSAIRSVANPGGTWTWSWGSGQGAAFLREEAAKPLRYKPYTAPEMCGYCDVEPATEGKYCEACAPAVALVTEVPA